MRLYYISFFYFNILLLLFLILKIDIIFLIFLFLRKTYSIFKESLNEYIFQEFDGLRLEGQFIDLYENKLYVDFGLDAGLEDFYIQNVYMCYALYDINLDFETYSGLFTFKWNDFNIEELNINKSKNINYKKIYIDPCSLIFYPYVNFKEQNLNRTIEEEDYTLLYNYKHINKRDIEEPLFIEENEKYYYNYLKLFFLKENYYDTFIKDNYKKNYNYNLFINNLKKKVLINKYKKKEKNVIFKENLFFLEFNENMLKIKNELLDNSFFRK